MSHRVRINAGCSAVLPDGGTYEGEVEVLLTNQQFAEIDQSFFEDGTLVDVAGAIGEMDQTDYGVIMEQQIAPTIELGAHDFVAPTVHVAAGLVPGDVLQALTDVTYGFKPLPNQHSKDHDLMSHHVEDAEPGSILMTDGEGQLRFTPPVDHGKRCPTFPKPSNATAAYSLPALDAITTMQSVGLTAGRMIYSRIVISSHSLLDALMVDVVALDGADGRLGLALYSVDRDWQPDSLVVGGIVRAIPGQVELAAGGVACNPGPYLLAIVALTEGIRVHAMMAQASHYQVIEGRITQAGGWGVDLSSDDVFVDEIGAPWSALDVVPFYGVWLRGRSV